MEVQILKDGPYSTFRGGVAEATPMKAGALVNFPQWYALELRRMGLAKLPGAPDPPQARDGEEEAGAQVNATEGALALAESAGVDLRFVKGTGSSKRILQRDVEEFIRQRDSEATGLDEQISEGTKNRRKKDVTASQAFGVSE